MESSNICLFGDSHSRPRTGGALDRELGAGFAGLVAQRDHVVEPAACEGVEVSRLVAGDVDAELVAQDPHGVEVHVGFGSAAGACHGHAVGVVLAQKCIGNR
jgi:hypothetical protein